MIFLELSRAFFKLLGLHAIAGIGWVDFACQFPLLSKIPLVLKFHGYRYIVYVCEMVLCYFVFHPDYEKTEKEIMHKLSPSVFIDIGAHVGYYTILAHKLGAEKIIAVEPDVRTYRILKRVVDVNKLDNITVINSAVWDKSGVKLKLHLSRFSGHSSVFPLNLKKRDILTIIDVRTTTLDEIGRTLSLEKIDLVKIDVEGAEFNVLLGAVEVINRFRPLILIEIKDINRENVLNFLESKQYKFFGPFSYGENYLCIPAERDKNLHMV